MNELKIEFTGGDYLYFSTDKDRASKAFDDFLAIIDNHPEINMDNMYITEIVLRDSNGNDIDDMKV